MKSRPVFFQISRNRRKAASAPAMRPKALSGSIAKYSRGLALSVLTLIGASQALGVTYYWDTNTTIAGAGATPTGTWGTSNFWNTDPFGVTNTFTTATAAADNLYFVAGPSATSGNNAYVVTVSTSQVANSLNFQASGATTISGGTLITVGNGTSGNGGINIPQYAYGTTNNGAVTISTAVTLNNTQTWTNNSANTFTFDTSALTLGTTKTLTIAGSGNTTISGSSIANTSGSIAKTGTGTLTITTAGASNLYTGTTTVSNGTLLLNSSGTIAAKGGTTVASGSKLQLQGGVTAADALTISQPALSTFAYSGLTNGTATTNGVYTTLAFTSTASNGTFTVGTAGKVEYLVIAGGGGGGGKGINSGGAGGGAGGYLSSVAGELSGGNVAALTAPTFATGSYTIGVGAGGGGGSGNGTSGSASVIQVNAADFVRANGGGGGGGNGGGGANGGSGGGSTVNTAAGQTVTATVNGVPGFSQGFNGGRDLGNGDVEGGGGGAGQVGGSRADKTAGSGGNGLYSSITGSLVARGGGGGGGAYQLGGGYVTGAGGLGGGGNGGGYTNANLGSAGTANTGGGGGGGTGTFNSDSGYAGGSGFVALRYVSDAAALENVSGNNEWSGAVTLGSYIGIRSIAGTLKLSGAIGQSSSGYGITTLGAGTVALTNTNTYTGTTTVSAGTLDLQGSLSGTTGVTVNTGGTLLLNNAATPAINSGASMTVGGGTVKIDNSLSNTNQTFGSLTLTDTSILDFGTGSAGNTMTFASLSFTGTKLNVWNWSGSAYGAGVTDTGSLAGDTQDRLLFTANTSFGPAEDSSIEFFSGAGTGSLGFGQEVMFGGQYELVPITAVPEPATTALIGSIALCALIGYRERRRFTGFGKRTAARK